MGLKKESCSGFGVADTCARHIADKNSGAAKKIGCRSRFRAICREAAFKKGPAVNSGAGPNPGPIFESAPGYALTLRRFAL
jgi:hypothetical protein